MRHKLNNNLLPLHNLYLKQTHAQQHGLHSVPASLNLSEGLKKPYIQKLPSPNHEPEKRSAQAPPAYKRNLTLYSSPNPMNVLLELSLTNHSESHATKKAKQWFP